MGKIVYLLFFLTFNSNAVDFENMQTSLYIEIENILHRELHIGENLVSKKYVPGPAIEHIFNDPEMRVSPDFKITPFFRDRTLFWFLVYTQFSSHEVIVHDKDNLKLIYEIIDFSNLKNATFNKYVKSNLQSVFANHKISQVKTILYELAKNPKNKGEAHKSMITFIKSHQINIPSKPNDASKFFKSLANNIRAQTGQKNLIFQGLINSTKLQPFIFHHLKQFNIPRELLALPFLESSFNINAISKVGASGIWQFMPNIAAVIMDMDKNIDPRLNPFLSSIGAIHLLNQNFKILKSWDLAITAYNSGTKHLVRARNKMKNEKLNLELFIKNYDHPHIGFASTNFYAEFLALTITIDYMEKIFPLEGIEPESLKNFPTFNTKDVKLYLSLCPHPLNLLWKENSPFKEKYKFLNSHILNEKVKLPRGTIFFSDEELDNTKFYKLDDSQIKKVFPIKYKQFIKDHKCSIK